MHDLRRRRVDGLAVAPRQGAGDQAHQIRVRPLSSPPPPPSTKELWASADGRPWGGGGRYDCGIQTFDTAPVYSNGLSEAILGEAIKRLNLPRDEIVVMTKVCHVPPLQRACRP